MPSPPLQFSVIADTPAFELLREDWNALWLRSACPHIFLSFNWCWSAWRRVAQARGYDLCIVTGRLGGELVLLWPLMSDHGVLRMLSADILEYRDLIVAPSAQGADWTRQAWQFVVAEVPADAFFFQNLRRPNALGEVLAHQKRANPVGGGWCPVIRLDRFAGWEAYSAHLPKSLLSDQRRQWKRLREVLPGIAFARIESAAEIAPVMDWIGRHKVAWGEARGTPDVWHASPHIRALLDEVAVAALRDGQLVMATLADGGTLVSAGLGYVCGGDFLFHAFAYDAAYARCSPSRLFLECLVRWCFDQGVRTFDFMPGEQPYKRTWATDHVQTDSYFGPLSWRGACLMRLSRLRQMAIGAAGPVRRMSRWLPQRVRESISARLREFRLVRHALDLKPVEPPPTPEPAVKV